MAELAEVKMPSEHLEMRDPGDEQPETLAFEPDPDQRSGISDRFCDGPHLEAHQRPKVSNEQDEVNEKAMRLLLSKPAVLTDLILSSQRSDESAEAYRERIGIQ